MKFIPFFIIVCIGLESYATAEPKPVDKVVREDIEWLDVWMPASNDNSLPRILLIGDSITRNYYPQVQGALAGKASVARLATSKSLGDPALPLEVALVLSECRFDVIHFNNGMHGFGYSEDDYRRCFPELIEVIRKAAPKAKLIFATTTPVKKGGDMAEFDEKTKRIRVRNAIGIEFCAKAGIQVNDLFALVENHPEFYLGGDGVHLGPKGVSAQAETVADALLKLLPSSSKTDVSGE